MIATNEAVDVLRHGWQDAASTLAEGVPEVADLLHARLEMAISSGRLDENHLLDTIQEVESVTARAGSGSSQALARRLRRTVYEYLLALDAAQPLETARAPVEPRATAPDSPMVGVEEVAALGHISAEESPEVQDAQPAPADASAAPAAAADAADALTGAADTSAPGAGEDDNAGDDAPAAGTASSRRRFALRRRQQRLDGEAGTAAAAEASEAEGTEPQPPGTPEWRYTAAGEPAVFPNDIDGAAATETLPVERGEPDLEPADDAPTADSAMEAGGQSIGDPGLAAATTEGGFVAPRAGFHIVEDAPAHRADAVEESRLEMPVFSADEPPGDQAPVPASGATGSDAGTEFLAWAPHGAPGAPTSDADSPTPAAAQVSQPLAPAHDPLPAPLEAASPEPDVEAAGSDDDPAPRGWGVRRPGEAHSSRRGDHSVAATPIEDDPFETNSRLADIRRRIEDRLRKKRCDEAAALLQELAQEAGGRAVAELAMNAGDRCRALGKSNAALNCYLAAARSDPVYEMPLSRLADICIDNQDTELAVSYLERIARLYRYRGDETAAIRVYRRIATVAPYRDDVLSLLMNAQRTGRLE